MPTMEEIRAKLLAQSQRNNNNNGDRTRYVSDVYPFWNLEDNGVSEVRFLPDGNPNNVFFWEEVYECKFPFQGVVGQTDKEVYVKIPSLKTFGERCIIEEEIKDWWDNPEYKPLASVYYRKRSYVYQGFVFKDGINEQNKPAKPIRRFLIGPQIHEMIKATLTDPEMIYNPSDYDNGRDFKIIKTRNGKQPNYGTSKFSMNPRPLNQMERDAIAEHGLYDLKSFLPKKPDAAHLDIIREMFEASLEGKAYDPARWGNYYKPRGFGGRDDTLSDASGAKTVSVNLKKAESVPTVTPAPTTVATQVEEDAPFDVSSNAPATPAVTATTTPAASAGKAQDAKKILELIRNRNATPGTN